MSVLLGIVNWSCYKVDYIYKHKKGRYVNINYRYRGRWYSPIFLIFCIFNFLSNWYKQGFSIAFKILGNYFTYNKPTWISFYTPKGYSKIRKKAYIFSKIYT